MEGFQSTLLYVGNEKEGISIGEILKNNFNYIQASATDKATLLLQEKNPDCVLLDIDAFDSKELIQGFIKNGAAVITLTSSNEGAEHYKSAGNGVTDCLLKQNINKKMLLRVTQTAIERHHLSQMALALKHSEERLRDITDRIKQGLWVRSVDDGACLYINPAFEKIWGRTLKEMNKQPWSKTIHPDDREKAYKLYIRHKKLEQEYTHTYRIVRPDGEIRWIENHAYPVFDNDRNMLRMSGIARDITKQRQLEEELRLAQKLESLGQLSAGIAHEINTPCQYVSDNIAFLNDSVEDIKSLLLEFPKLISIAKLNGSNTALATELEQLEKRYQDTDVEFLLEEIPSALEQSRNGMEQIKKIITAMKGFSHPGNEKVHIDLNEAISNTITVAKNEWKYVAEITTQFDNQLPRVLCLPSAINQVVLNILVNAAHAISEKNTNGELGKITIGTTSNDHLCQIKIQDNGPGMSKEIAGRIFDPFFTTKEVGKGTGQGLAIVHKIIKEDHGGSIVVESTPDVGTCFIVNLPIEPGAACAQEPIR